MPVQSTDLDAFDPSCPLRGAVLCCTSIPPEKRTELAERAEEMGAKHVYDLTSDVTHLIVGEYDTPKYRYVAKERPDVLIIDPSWVDAVRALWIADQKIDLEALEKLHTLPTFASLKISVTGFEDHTERQRITELVQAHGAEYHGNLTKQVTHLLAFRTEGPKYKHATQWGMRIVSVEWLHDSIERGMTLNEKLYHPDIPVEDRGKDAWIRRKLPVARSRKRTRAEDVADEGRRKLRRTASSRLSSMSEKMWGDIMVSGASAVIEQAHAGEWEESKVQADVAQPVGKSDEDTKTSKSIFTNHPRPKKPRALLTGLQFYLYGFSDKRQKRLEEFLPSHDARLAPTLDSLAEENPDIENSYILVPHDLQSSDYPAIPESLSNIPMITEFWVERCYDMKSIQEPSAHILGRPFTRFPIPKFSGLIISSTAFTGFELLHVSKVVELLGAKYDEYLTPKHSVLICASPESMTSAKFNHAQEWKIPVVSAKWLWDSIEAGERLPFRSYLYRVKKTLKETESMTSEGGVDRATNDDSRSNAETEGPVSSSSARDPKTQSFSEHSSDLVPTLPLERNPHTAIEVKAEEDTQFNGSTESLPTQSNKALLTEISGNPTKSDSSIPKLTPPLTSALTAPIPVSREYIDNAISSLLARSKASSNPPLAPESTTTDGKKPLARRRTRILGRATSNVSVASAASIESSVDSTATHGNAVHWPSAKSIHENDDLTKDQEGESRERNDKGVGERESESQPQQSQQLKWEEEESTEYKNRIFKKITGKGSVDDRRGSGGKVKERAVTLGDLNVMPRVNRSGLKMRGGGGGGRVVRNT